MKKLLLTLVVGLMGISAAFADATITMKDLKVFAPGNATMEVPADKINLGDFDLTIAKAEGSTPPAFNKAGDVRLYAKSTLTIDAKNDMTKIVFKISAQGLKRLAPITASVGAIAPQASGDVTVTWTGSAKSVVFTVGEKADYGTENTKAGQFDFDVIEIVGGGNATVGSDPEPGDELLEVAKLLGKSDANGLEGWTIQNVTLPAEFEAVWAWRSYNGEYYLNGSTNKGGTAYAGEAYAISPVVDLTKATEANVSFDHAARFQTNLLTDCKFQVRVQGDADWTNLTIPTWPTAGSWTFVNSGAIDLKAYAGKKIEFRYVYIGTDTQADTWEIRDLIVKADAGETPTPPTPATENYKLATTLAAGEYVVVVNVDGTMKLGTAIGKDATFGRLNLADVTVNAAGTADANVDAEPVNALTIAVEADGVTIKDSYGRYLGMDNSHSSSFQLYTSAQNTAEANTYWTIANVSAAGELTIQSKMLFNDGTPATIGVTKGTQGTWYNNIAPAVLADGAEIALPMAFAKNTSGIGEIVNDDANAPVEYFNLQGVRVANPENGLYIRRQGGKATKVIVR